MKSFLLLFFLMPGINYVTNEYGIINQQVDKLFFNTPLLSDKFATRNSLNLNKNFFNVADYKDYCECISADFISQPMLRYIGSDKSLIIWFDATSKKSTSRKITFNYTPDQYSNCLAQLNDLQTIYKAVSYKSNSYTVADGKGEHSGEGLYFYSSESNYKLNKSFLNIGYRYVDMSKLKGHSMYIFDITLEEINL